MTHSKTYNYYLNIRSNIDIILNDLTYIQNNTLHNTLYFKLRFLNIENKLKSVEKLIPSFKYPPFKNQEDISSLFNYVSFLKKNINNIKFKYLYNIQTLIYNIKIEVKFI